MATEQIEIEIVLDDGSVQRGFANIKKEAKDTGTSLAAGLGKNILKLGTIASAAALALGGIITAKGIAAAREQEEAVNSLAASLGKLGQASRLTELEEFASGLQRITKFGDEAIISQLAFAQAMGANVDQSKQIVEAATDMSAALNIDLNSAVRNISKTLGGYAGELGEVIPELKNLTTEQLRSGDGVDLLAKRFRGFAGAEIKTFGGAMTQLSNSFGDFLEGIGNFLVKSPAFVTVINETSKLFGDLSRSLKEAGGTDIVKDFIINFSVVAQAGAESARRIGLSFELAFLRAQQAFFAFKVATTLGLSEAFNTELDAVLQEIDKVKKEFSEDSAITIFFDNLIMKVQETRAQTVSMAQDTAVAAESMSLSFSAIAANMEEAAKQIKINALDISKNLIQGIASGAGNAFAAFGKAIAKGENALEGFINSLISSMGQMAIQLGTQFILQGLAYLWAGLPNGPALIAAGSALAAFGGVLSAVGGGNEAIGTGEGAQGGLTPTLGAGDLAAAGDTDADLISQTGVTINVDGTVIDPKTTGENIASALQEFFDQSGGQLVVNA